MKAWQAHQALASAVGDPIEVDTVNGEIPDGVRYTKKARSLYIDRGINSILSTFIQHIQASRVDDKAMLVYQLFPTFTRNNTISISTLVSGDEVLYPLPVSFDTAESKAPLLILDCSYYYIGTGIPIKKTREQIPVMSPNQYNQTISRRFDEDFYADTIAVYYGAGNGFTVYNSKNMDSATVPDHLEMNYLPQPKELEDHAWDEEVDFEAMYVPRAIYQASLFALGDSGDINLQAMAQQLAPMLGGLNAGNNG